MSNFDDDYYQGQEEPNCYQCDDRGFRPVSFRVRLDPGSVGDLAYATARTIGAPGYLLLFDPKPARYRAGRRHCSDCNPSPRQRRRWPKYLRRLERYGGKLQRDADRRRARGEPVDESPF